MVLFKTPKPLTTQEMQKNLDDLAAENARLMEKANYLVAKKALIEANNAERLRIKQAQPSFSLNSFIPGGNNKKTLIIGGIIVIILVVAFRAC